MKTKISHSQGGTTMKKKLEHEEQQQDLEILKAVAQAWYSHSGNSRPISEFDEHRRGFKGKPSRFKEEAMRNSSSSRDTSLAATHWDFQQSLWDSYELVTVSRRIEVGLALDDYPFDDLTGSVRVHRRGKKESKNSLRKLFDNLSSRRFNSTKVPKESDNNNNNNQALVPLGGVGYMDQMTPKESDK